MNRTLRNGLALAVAHLLIVGSLGVKLLVDRQVRPRVWIRAAPIDPNLPIRGRYVSLALQIDRFEGIDSPLPEAQRRYLGPDQETYPRPVSLVVRDGQLVAVAAREDTGVAGFRVRRGDRETLQIGAVAYFVPESVADPSVRSPGEELWVEATIPRRGTPRPIRLGVKKDGVLTPLALR